ncbi:MAG: ribosome assembly cofactor RimP [Rikenellaceae bacterium]
MIAKEKIEKIVTDYISQDYASENSLFLVDVKVSTSNIIEVIVDAIGGVDITKCIEISRHIETFFNRDEEDFELTVASAGISDPLKKLEQFHKHSGKEVEVKYSNGDKLVGVMSDVTAENFVVSYQVKELVEGKKRKQLVDKQVTVAYDEVKTVRLVIKF